MRLEKVQIKAVGMISGLTAGASYEEKCQEVGLETLEVRRMKQDLIQTYKIMNGQDRVDRTKVFTHIQDRGLRTRAAANPLNMVVPRARLDLRKHSFVRAPDIWNRLPDRAKNARSVIEFKNAITYTQDERLGDA